eukprot:sb/3462482/
MVLKKCHHPSMGEPRPPMTIFSGQSHRSFAEDVCNHVGIRLGLATVSNNSSTETDVTLNESIRGKEVFVIQSGSKRVNNDVFEMLNLVYACKTSCARRVIAVVPYLPYSQQCRMRRRACITSKLIAKMMCNAGINHLITMDLHQREIHGFFDCSVDNLRSSPFLLQHILDTIPDYKESVIIARHPSATRRATSYAERLQVNFAVMHGELKAEEEQEVDGRTSPPLPSVFPQQTPFACSFPMPIPSIQQKIKPSPTLVGTVKDKVAIVLDDIIDDVEPWALLAGFLKERGARRVVAMAPHGILSGKARQFIEQASSLDRVVITNTVPLSEELRSHPKISVVDVSKMFAEAIRRTHNGESIHVGIRLGLATVSNNSSTETDVTLNESIRGKEVFVIQSGSKRVNNDVFEMLNLVYACKTSCARRVIAVVPYLPYSQQCRMRRRACITSKLIAKMMCNAGINHLITMDLHQREIHGFFDCSVDNLRSSPFLLQHILDTIPDYKESVIIARHPSATRRATSYAERLQVNFAVMHGELKAEEEQEVDGRTSPPLPSVFPQQTPFACSFPMPIPSIQQKIKPSPTLVGTVKDKVAIVLDDIIDDVEPWALLAGFLKERGARRVVAMAPHGILSGKARQFIEQASSLDRVVITNTVPLSEELRSHPKISVVDVSKMFAEAIRRTHNGEMPLSEELRSHPKISVVDVSKMFAEAIRRTHNGESMSKLFTNVTED